jgi:hypothetical protein
MNFKKILLTFTILFISANYSYSQRATATEWKNLIYAIEEHEMFNIIQNKYNPHHDIELACRLWAVGLVALNNPNKGKKSYREFMAIYERNFGKIKR